MQQEGIRVGRIGLSNLEGNSACLGRLAPDLRTQRSGGWIADRKSVCVKHSCWPLFSPLALVYLHRYTKDTVNTLLNGYLREFRHKLTHRRDQLEGMVAGGSATTADRKALKTTLEAIKDVETYELARSSSHSPITPRNRPRRRREDQLPEIRQNPRQDYGCVLNI